MEQQVQVKRSERAQAPAPVPEIEAPAPAAPVPLTVGTMTVGHAEDRAEAEADAMADTALARLPRTDADTHQHGPGCDHVRRSAAPAASGDAAVGYEGGALDAATSAEIAGRRGGGRPLAGPVLQRMQTAFGRDFSGVRVHDDAGAARLNRKVSARAFTTGADIFFGQGEYAPDTSGGERVLAHELAHTLQPAAGVHRLVGQGAPEGAEPVAVRTTPGEDMKLTELLAMDDSQLMMTATATGAESRLLDIMRGCFEADWFKAKECLVFSRWPGERTPVFQADAGMRLMEQLTVLRGEVHARVMAKTQAKVNEAIATRSATLTSNKPLKDALDADLADPTVKQVEYKESSGANTMTSDVDVSTKGPNSELAVGVYNATFREEVKLGIDPGTFFDLNVYAMDFVHGVDKGTDVPTKTTTLTVKTEHALPEATPSPDAEEDAKQSAEEQDVWALVHVARFMPRDADWNHYVRTALGAMTPSRRPHQQSLFVKARARAKAFEVMLESRMEALTKEVDNTLATLGPSQWGEENEHFKEGAVRMRAANQLYEAKLLQVKELRVRIAAAKTARADQATAMAALPPEKVDQVARDALAESDATLRRLVLQMSNTVSMASLYANEVYGSGGATVHAVFGIQTKRKAEAEAKAKDPEAKVKVSMSPDAWYQAFNDNLGDVLKDFEHFGVKHGKQQPDYKYAAFKMGKYADRMVDAFGHLAEEKLITPKQAASLANSSEVTILSELATEHVEAKAGPAGENPNLLGTVEYFARQNARSVVRIKRTAISLGAKVRAQVANTRAEVAARGGAPVPAAAPALPKKLAAERLDALAGLVAQLQAGQKKVEEATGKA